MKGFDKMRAGWVRRAKRAARRWRGVATVVVLSLGVTAGAQDSPSQALEPSRVDVAEIVAGADDAERELREIEVALAREPTLETITERLPETTAEIDEHFGAAGERLAASPSLDAIREVEAGWARLEARLAELQQDLTARVSLLRDDLTRLERLEQTWARSLDEARQANLPPETIGRAEAVIVRSREVRTRVEDTRQRVLALQSRVGDQQSRVRDALATARLVREGAVGRLFTRDSPNLWTVLARTDAAELSSGAGTAIDLEVATLDEYARRSADRFALHLGLILAAAAGASWARRRVRPWVVKEPCLEVAAAAFDHPLALALVLTTLATGWVHPQAPRALGALLGVLVLAATALVLWRLVNAALRPLLVALVVLFLADGAVTFVRAVPLASRLVLLVQAAAAVLFLAWFARRTATEAWARRGALAGGVTLAIAIVASVLGYVTLSRFVVAGCLGSAYAAVVLYATAKIVDGLLMFAMRVRPLALLRFVRRHRPTLRHRISIVVRWGLGLVWVLVTLDLFSVRERVVVFAAGVLSSSVAVGAYSVSLGDVLLFAASIAAAIVVSRFLLFVLEEDVYPRTDLPRGVPYAVSTIARYTVLFVGFVFALGAMGVDLSRFTILAGAFGVGLGLGLQNVVANFASGIVLLFERPVKVGDTVEVDAHAGDLKRIGLRASVLRTWEGSEVIVPNADLVSEKVINWTLSDQQRRIAVDVGVAYGTDPERVVALLTEAALAHPDVMADPAPQALFLGFGDSALDFQLRAWTSQFDRWIVVRSDLAIRVNAVLGDAGIEIPFPQRELRVVSVSPDSLDELRAFATESKTS